MTRICSIVALIGSSNAMVYLYYSAHVIRSASRACQSCMPSGTSTDHLSSPMKIGQALVDEQAPSISTPTDESMTSVATLITYSIITRKPPAWETRSQFGGVLVFAINTGLFRDIFSIVHREARSVVCCG